MRIGYERGGERHTHTRRETHTHTHGHNFLEAGNKTRKLLMEFGGMKFFVHAYIVCRKHQNSESPSKNGIEIQLPSLRIRSFRQIPPARPIFFLRTRPQIPARMRPLQCLVCTCRGAWEGNGRV